MTKRDLNADLAVCNAATEGPWAVSDLVRGYVIVDIGKYVPIATTVEYHDDGSEYLRLNYDDYADNQRFIAEARTGWPHAIERALAAEIAIQGEQEEMLRVNVENASLRKEVERMRDVLEMIRSHAWNDVNLREGGVGVGTPKFQSPLVARQYIRSIDWALGEGQRKVTRGYTCDKCGFERWEEMSR